MGRCLRQAPINSPDRYILYKGIFPSKFTCFSSFLIFSRCYQDFTADRERAERWSGLRQDSGDPFAFAPKAREIYTSLGIDHASKMIVYSDALTVDKVLDLKRQCDQEGLKCMYLSGLRINHSIIMIYIYSIFRYRHLTHKRL
jgi:hypothetical protein